MTSVTRVLTVTIAVAVVISTRGPATSVLGAQQPQTFRATADVVIVDVSIRQNGAPVPGLTAADFVVLDNGVRQDIERVEATSVPIDLTIVADVSYKHTDVMATLRADLTQIGGALRPFDRIRVLAFDDHVREVVPFQPATDSLNLVFTPRGHQASLTDAIIMALATPVAPDRRHVVILRTRGTDTISLTDVSRLQNVAASSDAQLHIIFDEMTVFQELTTQGFRCGQMDRCLPMENFWQPHRRLSQMVRDNRLELTPFGEVLQATAVTTGGRVHVTQVLNPPTVRSTFERVFELFRESYVLRYVPKGVTREGWHAITVTVPAHRRAVVSARRGYGVDSLLGSSAASRMWLAPGTSGELWSLVTAFDGRQSDAVARALLATEDLPELIAEFRELGNPWPTEPWRESVLALELAELAMSSNEKARRAAYELVQAQARLLRHPFEADDFERYWHWAVVAMAQGTLRAVETRWTIDEALRRFPEEPRFVLGKAISADQEWSLSAPGTVPGSTRPSFRAVIEPMYRAAMMYPESEDEARVRLAWGLYRQGAYSDALVLLQGANQNTAQAAADQPIAYLRDVFMGHTLVQLKRHPDAIAAYRRAVAKFPSAQSARVSLMNTLLLTGNTDDRAEAEALAESVQTERATVPDPWWTYWQGDYRLYPNLIQYLRERRR